MKAVQSARTRAARRCGAIRKADDEDEAEDEDVDNEDDTAAKAAEEVEVDDD